jgi:HK97 family phage major capsid protein
MNYQAKIRDLYTKRNELLTQMRSLMQRSEDAGESMPATDADQFEALKKAIDELDARIKRLEEALAMESASRSEGDDEESDETDKRSAPPSYTTPQPPKQRSASSGVDRVQAFRRAIVNGVSVLSPTEKRAIIQSDDTLGGYLMAYEEFVAELIKAVDNEIEIQSLCPAFTLSKSKRIRLPSYDTLATNATWTSELTSPTADSAMSFGGRMVEAWPLAKLIKISVDMLQEASIDSVRAADDSGANGPIENLLKTELVRSQAYAIEEAYLTGNGVGRPLGIFVASDDGIPTSADTTVDISANGTLADDLLNVYYALKKQYRKRARWILSRQALKTIRLLKDGEGRYLFQAGESADVGDRLNGTPIIESEFVPNTLASGTYFGALADLSFYQTVQTKTVQWYELRELYVTAGQVGFYTVIHRGGRPLLSEAFKRIKVA